MRGGINLYGYVGNDPINWYDSRGTGPEAAALPLLLSGGGGAAAGGSAAALNAAIASNPVGWTVGALAGGYILGTIADQTLGISTWVANSINAPVYDASKNPWQGTPGSESTCPTKSGGPKQTRRYGPDGYPETDTDFDHDHGQGQPHVHDWGRPPGGGPPTDSDRAPGRTPQPGDPGIPTPANP
jgi:hypothetical protein